MIEREITEWNNLPAKAVNAVLISDIRQQQGQYLKKEYSFTLERDVMENTVQAGTPAKVSKGDVEQDIE